MQILGIRCRWNRNQDGHRRNDDRRTRHERTRVETPRPATPEAIGTTLKAVIAEHKWKSDRHGFPGRDPARHRARRPTSTSPSSDCGGQYFSRRPARRSTWRNDADVAGMAEMRFGAGKDNPGVVLIITIGTGLPDGAVQRWSSDAEYELGHVFLSNGSKPSATRPKPSASPGISNWKDRGERLNLLPDDDGKPALARPDRARRGVSEAAKFSPMITAKGAGCRRELLNQAGIVGAALFAESRWPKK